MKKLISIGVALALLTMAVVPAAVAADDYDLPETYAKVPFAIIASGFQLLENLWPDLDVALGMDMLWLGNVFGELAAWTGGPLGWSVDFLAWGVDLTGKVVAAVPMITDMLPEGLDLEVIFETIACGLMTCWSATNCTGEFDPCGIL